VRARVRPPPPRRRPRASFFSPFFLAEGVYTGQYLYAGTKAQLAVGNILPVSRCPEGTIICNVERYAGDRGKLAKASGDYCIVISHSEDTGMTKIRMPSGGKKNIASTCRAMVRCAPRAAAQRRRAPPLAPPRPTLASHSFFSSRRSASSPAAAARRSPCSRPGARTTSSTPSATSGPRCAAWP
jgi:hypothetical protein